MSIITVLFIVAIVLFAVDTALTRSLQSAGLMALAGALLMISV